MKVPCTRLADPPSTADQRLLEVEVTHDAAHHLWGDLAAIAQRHDGLPLRREQLSPPTAPSCGTLRVLLSGSPSLNAGGVASDALFVLLAHALLRAGRDPRALADLREPAVRRVGSLETRPQLRELSGIVVIVSETQHVY